MIRKIEEYREAARGDAIREDAIAAVVQAAYSAATALNALEIRSEPVERHLLGPTPEPGPLAHLPDLTAELAALCAFTAAVDAADAVGYSGRFVKGAAGDYRTVLGLQLGEYPEAGRPIDPSPKGPLGSLDMVYATRLCSG